MGPQQQRGGRAAGATEQTPAGQAADGVADGDALSEEDAAALAALSPEELAELTALAEAGVDLSGLNFEPQPAVVAGEGGEGVGNVQANPDPPAPTPPSPNTPPPDVVTGPVSDQTVAPNSTGAKETPAGANPHEALEKRATATTEAALAGPVDETAAAESDQA